MLSTSRLLGLACLLTAPLAPGAAQGWIEPIRPLPAFPRVAIAKVRSAVQVTLTGRAAHVTVEEWFRNSGPELAGHGLLRARVFPIAPGETRKITLRYTQLLDRVGDAWRFRYSAGTGPGAASSSSFRMQVDSAARFGDPYSPTHRLNTSRR